MSLRLDGRAADLRSVMRHSGEIMIELTEYIAEAARLVGKGEGHREEPEQLAEQILRKAGETLQSVDEIQIEDMPRARDGFQPMLSVVELVAMTSLDLAMLMADAGHQDVPALMWAEGFETSARPAMAAGLLLTHVTNAQLTIRLLTLHGFDTQARIQLRSLIEFADLAVAACADAAFMAHYLKAFETFRESRMHWQQKLRPSTVRARLDELLPDTLRADIRSHLINGAAG